MDVKQTPNVVNKNIINFKAIIFDLDGTLLDTLEDLAEAANRTLAHFNYPTHPIEDYKMFVGNGLRTLVTRILPEDQRLDSVIEKCQHHFVDDYQQNWDVATKIYPGITDLIEILLNHRVKLSVVTNKPHQSAHIMLAHYFEKISFSAIYGQQPEVPKKPHPRQALAAANQMGVSPQECVFLGDSNVDMETAKRAGMQAIGAGWGFRTPLELRDAGALRVLDHPLELIQGPT